MNVHAVTEVNLNGEVVENQQTFQAVVEMTKREDRFVLDKDIM